MTLALSRILALVTLVMIVAMIVPLVFARGIDYRGREIAYLRYDVDDGRWQIHRFDIATGGDIVLSNIDISPESLEWRPEGDGFVFSAGFSGRDLYTVDLSGENLHRLPGRGERDQNPVPSPDGQMIAFLSSEDNNPIPNPTLYLVEITSGVVSQLTRTPDLSGIPSWSPDGTQLVFSGSRDQRGGLFVVDVAERSVDTLANTPVSARNPDWSPDGERIAFVGLDNAGTSPSVYTLHLDDGSSRRLTSDDLPANVPRWSPDGERVMFWAFGLGDVRSGVYVVNADGGASRRILAQTDDQRILSPVWRP